MAEEAGSESNQHSLLKEIEKGTELRPTNVEEKIVLPDNEAIQQEKGEAQFRKEIEKGAELRHVEVQEKNPLPTKEIIEEEKKMNADQPAE